MTMSKLVFTSLDGGDPFVRPKAPTRALTGYRVDAIASDVGDVIRSAGGWLFDRAMAGWDVNIVGCEWDANVVGGDWDANVAGDDCDARPLRILGAKIQHFDSAFASVTDEQWAQTLAVAVDAFTTDARVREIVAAALDRGAEVTLWGEGWPTRVDHRVETAVHRLSSAARAFKAHALAAAGFAAEVVGATEKYRRPPDKMTGDLRAVTTRGQARRWW